jgi:hypothetical protein
MNRHRLASTVAASALVTAAALAAKTTLTPAAGLAWADAGVPGVAIAAVEGDPKSGPSHFYLRYPAGFVAPLHHHTPTVSGELVLIADGKETRLAPGSYFAFLGGAAHAVRCESTEPCVMFIDARAAWDVVLEPAQP